ncbi:hypothetical protein L2E82_36063 [Cichorium intybus]|uniref:Uncharacterized protein n=1 Tax=Cichorium intybus TaxID=13427 RepID=A0ACB9BQH1_CICIN|nr:hypothetical protein L2E82_36063 [Cichorium intybus]
MSCFAKQISPNKKSRKGVVLRIPKINWCNADSVPALFPRSSRHNHLSLSRFLFLEPHTLNPSMNDAAQKWFILSYI